MDYEAGERSWITKQADLPPEALLWVGVIEIAIQDAMSTKPSLDRDRAQEFLSGKLGDLRMILTMIGIDYTWWLAKCLPKLRKQWAGVEPRPQWNRAARRRRLDDPLQVSA